jgi:hypothetical protein
MRGLLGPFRGTCDGEGKPITTLAINTVITEHNPSEPSLIEKPDRKSPGRGRAQGFFKARTSSLASVTGDVGGLARLLSQNSLATISFPKGEAPVKQK